MLSRLKVRTKLLAILLPLLLGVGGLAAIGVMDRLDEQEAASRSLELVRSASLAANVVHEVQLEGLLTAALQAGTTGVQEDLEAQHASTDRAVRELRGAMNRLETTGELVGSQTPVQVATDVRRQLDEIMKAREVLDLTSGSVQSVIDNYTSIVDSLVTHGASMQLAAATSGESSSSHWLSSAKATDARISADVIAIIGATSLSSVAEAAWAVDEVDELLGQSANFTQVFTTDANDAGRQIYDRVLRSPEYAASQASFSQLDSIDPEIGLATPIDTWLTETAARLEVLHDAENTLFQREINTAQAQLTELQQQVRLYLGGSATALLLALLLAASVTRSITSNLNRLTTAARSISEEQLPLLVDSLNSPDGEISITPTDIEVRSQDEFADLANAFNAVEQAAIDVAAEQSRTLRKGISDIFVNLARRNQSLLDRQIEFIDRLEANEEDPDQLENLFRLDHLATRMRRNAESLLVLAGAEGPRKRAKEVSVSDIVRVAVGEVEDFARITLLAVEEAWIKGAAAVDLAHLLAELMENGTQYSPPDRRVEVVGVDAKDGGYVITVSDHGVGMTDEARHAANEQLATPPVVGLTLSRSLGFIVVSTLAARHGISVRLSESPSGGVTAAVQLPATLMAVTETDILEPTPVERSESEPIPVPTEPVDEWSFENFNFEGEATSGSSKPEPEPEPVPVPDEAFAAWDASTPTPTFDSDAETEGTQRWTAEVGEIGSPEPMPDADHPMGAALEQGLFALLASGVGGSPAEPGPTADPEPSDVGDVDAPQSWSDRAEPVESPSHSLVDDAVWPTSPTWAPEVEPEPAAEVEPAVEPEPAAEVEPEPVAEAAPRRRISMFKSRHSDTPDAGPAPSFAPDEAAAPVAEPDPAPVETVSPTPPVDVPVAEPMEPILPGAASGFGGLPRRPTSQPAGQQADETAATTPAPVGDLPRRAPRTPTQSAPTAATGLVATPSRPAEEIRNILSSYRSGLSSGRSEGGIDWDTLPDDTPDGLTEPEVPTSQSPERGHDEPTQH